MQQMPNLENILQNLDYIYRIILFPILPPGLQYKTWHCTSKGYTTYMPSIWTTLKCHFLAPKGCVPHKEMSQSTYHPCPHDHPLGFAGWWNGEPGMQNRHLQVPALESYIICMSLCNQCAQNWSIQKQRQACVHGYTIIQHMSTLEFTRVMFKTCILQMRSTNRAYGTIIQVLQQVYTKTDLEGFEESLTEQMFHLVLPILNLKACHELKSSTQ